MRIIQRNYLLAVALMAASQPVAADEAAHAMPASGPTDYGIVNRDELSPAKKLEVLPFELRGALGYYASSMKDSGPGGQFRFWKPYFSGGRDYGLQFDLLGDVAAYSDLHGSGKIAYTEAEFLGLAPIGAAGFADGEEHRTRVSGSILHCTGYYLRDTRADFEFGGARMDGIRFAIHHSFPGDSDVQLTLRAFRLGMGKGAQLGEALSFPFGFGSARVAFGQGLGSFARIRLFTQLEDLRNDTKEWGRNSAGNIKYGELLLWRFSAGVGLERMFGGPLGIAYSYSMRYFGYSDYPQEGMHEEQWLNQHFVALTAEYL